MRRRNPPLNARPNYRTARQIGVFFIGTCILSSILVSGLVLYLTLNIYDASQAHEYRGPYFARSGDDYINANPAMTYQRFAARKADETYRIFLVGGSQALGVPYVEPQFDYPGLMKVLRYSPAGGIATWLKDYMTALLPKKKMEVINAAAVAEDMSRHAMTVQEIIENGSPDLVIILGGDNERNLKRSIISKDKFGHIVVADPQNFEEALREQSKQYERAIADIVTLANRTKTMVYLLTVPDNLRDWMPYDKADFDESVLIRRLDSRLYAEALRMLTAQPYQHNALRLFYMARCYDGLHDLDKARSYYVRARDLDKSFLRSRTALNDIIRRSGSAYVHILDIESLLNLTARDQIMGFDTFWDHCHMRSQASQYCAYLIARQYATDFPAAAERADALKSIPLTPIPLGQLYALRWLKTFQWLRLTLYAILNRAPFINNVNVAKQYLAARAASAATHSAYVTASRSRAEMASKDPKKR